MVYIEQKLRFFSYDNPKQSVKQKVLIKKSPLSLMTACFAGFVCLFFTSTSFAASMGSFAVMISMVWELV